MIHVAAARRCDRSLSRRGDGRPPVPLLVAVTIAALGLSSLAGSARSAPAVGASSTVPISPRVMRIAVNVRSGALFVSVDAALEFEVLAPSTGVAFRVPPDVRMESVDDERGRPLDYEAIDNGIFVGSPPLARGAVATWHFRFAVPLDPDWESAEQVVRVTPWYPYLREPGSAETRPRNLPMRFEVSATVPPGWTWVAAGAGERTLLGAADRWSWSDARPGSVLPILIGRFAENPIVVDSESHRLTAFMPAAASALAASYADYMVDALAFYADLLGANARRAFTLVGLGLPDDVGGLSTPGVTVVQARYVTVDTPFPYRIFAHEVAHHWWFGTRFRDRSDNWLREGLPTYSALLFLEHTYGGPMFRRELERTRRVAIDAPALQPLLSSYRVADPRHRYALEYHKGAFVLHMLRQVMGNDGFLRLLRAAYEAGPPLTTDRFVGLAEGIHGDLSWFFEAWLHRAEIPRLAVRYSQRSVADDVSPFELTVSVAQRGATVRHPVALRVVLEGAPPVERRIWIDEGVVEAVVKLPSAARRVELDPFGDLLHGGIAVTRGGEGSGG